MNNFLQKSLLTMFGIGYSKYAPGTLASLITSLIYIFCFNFKINYFFLILFFISILIISIRLIDNKKNNFKEIDAKEIVIDEFLGQSIPLIFFYILLTMASSSVTSYIILTFISFVGFRFFDILKPFPINKIDKEMKNGAGVVLDDLVAGIFTLIVLYIFIIIYGNL